MNPLTSSLVGRWLLETERLGVGHARRGLCKHCLKLSPLCRLNLNRLPFSTGLCALVSSCARSFQLATLAPLPLCARVFITRTYVCVCVCVCVHRIARASQRIRGLASSLPFMHQRPDPFILICVYIHTFIFMLATRPRGWPLCSSWRSRCSRSSARGRAP